jgi:hypothetical protein
LASNLMKELSQTPGLYWSLCYRVPPLNAAIDVMWVIHDVADLAWAVRVKARLNIKQLWAGPTIVIVPSEAIEVVTSEAIDHYIVPCEWVSKFYAEEAPVLKHRLVVWPVGIDTHVWTPGNGVTETLLIYNKFQNDLTNKIAQTLSDCGIAYHIMTYGKYSPEEYRQHLRTAWGLVWLSMSETQGLAALEAMSMDVPVLAWDQKKWTYRDPKTHRLYSHDASSVPYFDSRCGETFSDLTAFSMTLKRFRERLTDYRPREFLLEQSLDLDHNLRRLPVLTTL